MLWGEALVGAFALGGQGPWGGDGEVRALAARGGGWCAGTTGGGAQTRGGLVLWRGGVIPEVAEVTAGAAGAGGGAVGGSVRGGGG